MGKSIVVLQGSPRRGANTSQLTDAFVGGAEEAGAKVTVFDVAHLKIGACLGCNHCFEETGVCVQKDDMPVILDAIRAAEVLVLASPIYFFGVNSQTKAAIDRTYALLKEGNPIKKAALLLTCGYPGTSITEPTVGMFREILDYQKWEEAGVVIAFGLHEPNEIEGKPQLEEARQLGLTI
jgi:multimeric flavodoxin WrbA